MSADVLRWLAAAVICLHLGAARLIAAEALQEPDLVVTALFPTNGVPEICPDTPLKITFASPPVVGTGKVQVFDAATGAVVETIEVSTRIRTKSIGGIPNFNYYPVLITGNEAALYLPDKSLGNAKTYYIKVDAGAFKSGDDRPFAGLSEAKAWHFSTKTAPPTPDSKRFVVAADGSGDFATVQGAIDSVPQAMPSRSRFSFVAASIMS